jgi:NADH-ubiquinone oxidoreductase chain 4
VSLLYVLLIIPIIGIFLISTIHSFYPVTVPKVKSMDKGENARQDKRSLDFSKGNGLNVDNKEYSFFDVSYYKKIAFITTILNLIVSLIIYMLFDFSNNQFQFIQENLDLSFYDIYLGVDGLSIYFVLLTTIIMPIALVSN